MYPTLCEVQGMENDRCSHLTFGYSMVGYKEIISNKYLGLMVYGRLKYESGRAFESSGCLPATEVS